MTPERKEMQRALKTFLVPQVRALGFSGSLPHFKRHINAEYQLLMLFFNKYGGSFYIDAGRILDAEVLILQNSWQERGKRLDISQLTVGHCNWKKQARLNPMGFIRDKDYWFVFSQDNTVLQAHVVQPAKFYDKIALQASSYMGLHAEDFFAETL